MEEILLFKLKNKAIKRVLYLLFFSKLSMCINIILNLVKRTFFYEGDLRRFILLNICYKCLREEKIIKKAIAETAEKLTLKLKGILDKEITILSAGLYSIIERFLLTNGCKFFKIFASKMYLKNGKVVIKEITLKDKKRILEHLRRKYNDMVIYYTDDIKELKYLKTNVKDPKIKVFLIKVKIESLNKNNVTACINYFL
ncbi:MAG: hypothetical protein ACTSXX_08380 [Candidatus Baldrarchaeia archaeon]